MVGFSQLRRAYVTATKYALLEQARNRLAFGLLLIFTPLWFFLFGSIISDAPVAFKLMGTGAFLQVNGHNMTVLTSGFNALTLIVGFTLYSFTRNGSRFDRRLVLSGYRQPVLMAAKVTALMGVAAFVSLVTVLIMLLFWRPTTFGIVLLGYVCAALIYGALGLLLGVLVESELVGFFLIIMISLIDTSLQAPIENPLANKRFLEYFPSYGPMQIAVSGGFTHTLPGASVALSLAWFVGFALVGLAIFWLRTRAWNGRQRNQSTAAVTA